MKVILICGKARSGKNQLADYLKEALDIDKNGAYFNRTLIRGNAQSVKDRAVNDHNWNGEKDAKGRQLLIDITNEGYDKDTYFWEKELFTEAIMYKEFSNRNCEYLIVPDWRYAQTLGYFNTVADKVITVKVTRPNNEVGTHDNHSSENDFMFFPIDVEVNNDKDLDNLKKVAKSIVQRCCN
jgi:hypothetical protein